MGILRNRKPFILCALAMGCMLILCLSGIAFAQEAPIVLYTDIVAGPNTGGENNNGAYLSIFGRNFGNDINSVKVYVGQGEVARYIYLGHSYGRPDVQQISVQLGPNVTTGAIKVEVNGKNSNTDHNFTVRPGNFYFVSKEGANNTGVVNDIFHPYRTPNYVMKLADFDAGDFIVMRGGDYDISSGQEDLGLGSSWFYVGKGSGSVLKNGTSETNAITLYGYPAEDVIIDFGSITSNTSRGIYSWTSADYFAFANLKFDLKDSGCPAVQLGDYTTRDKYCDHARLVNFAVYGGMAGGLTTRNTFFLCRAEYFKLYGLNIGNQSLQALPEVGSHMLYISHHFTEGDMGWCFVHDNPYGRAAVQISGDPNGGEPYLFGPGECYGYNTKVKVHDTLFENLPAEAVLCGLGSKEIYIYNNIIRNVCTKNASGFSPIALRAVGLNVGNYYLYNNTIYTDAQSSWSGTGGIIQMGYSGLATYPENIYIYNNIIYAKSPETNYYQINHPSFTSDKIHSDNNIWINSNQGLPVWKGEHDISVDPRFVDISAGDFTLLSNSPAVDSGTDAGDITAFVTRDFLGITRPQGQKLKYDIGAYEWESVDRDKYVLNFSDITSGPKAGNTDGAGGLTESEHGAIVTVWGNNLGSSQGNSKVYFKDSLGNSYEAAHIYYWVNADGKSGGAPADLYKYHKMQEIAFSIPASAADGPGKIYVEVGSEKSNELDFTVRDGKIYFVDDYVIENTGSGSFNDPWNPKSFIKRIDASWGNEDGAICYFKAGNYSGEYAHMNWYANFCLGDAYSGLPNSENSFIAYPGDIVNVDTGDTFRTNFRLYSSTDYINISKFKLKALRGCVESSNSYRVIGCYMDGIDELTASGVIVPNDNGGKIYGNEISGGGSGNKLDHAIYPSRGADNLDIGWNYIHDNNWAEGPMISINSNKAFELGYTFENVRIHNNVIDVTAYPSRAMGVFETGAGSTIYYYDNLIIGASCGAGASIYAMSGNVYYYNNTIYNGGSGNTGSVFYFYSGTSYDHFYAPESVVLRNNIIYANSNSNYYIKTAGLGLPLLDLSNNCYYGIGNYSGSEDLCPINADPLFVNPLGSDFKLLAVSPVIDAGSSDVFSVVKKDFLGNSRPIDGNSDGAALYDIGAFEYSVDIYGDIICDINSDGEVNVLDVQVCVNVILGLETQEGFVNKIKVLTDPQGECTVSDLQKVVNIILGV